MLFFKNMKPFFITILAFLISIGSRAQQPIHKQIPAKEIHGQIIIDGKLNEQAWAKLPVASDFTQIKPQQGESSHFRTLVKIGYDKKALYIAFISFLKEAPKNIRTSSMKRDFDWINNDFVALVLDGFNDKRNAMVFGTNPMGAQFDELSFNDQQYDKSWDGLWQVKTNVNDSSWIAEFSIPWETLRYDYSEHSQNWGINFIRLERETNELSAWNSYPRVYNFTRMQYAGKLTGLNVPKSKTNIQLTPYIAGNYLNERKDSFRKTHHTKIKGGGDLKWAINSNTILDFTVNPDFSQADADLQVNNVSRFSVYYPEKRTFFQENAAVFGPGLNIAESDAGGEMKMQFFNSRAIGLDSIGRSIPIEGGLRLVHRSASNDYGALLIREKNNFTHQVSYAGVFNYNHNFGKQNNIGTVNNFRIDRKTPTKYNLVNGVNGFFQMGKAHSISFMLLHSYTGTGSQKKSGWAGYMQYFYKTNPLRIWWTEALLSKNFSNRLGFHSKRNVIATSIGVYPYLKKLDWLPFHELFRSFEPGIAMDMFHNATTGDLSELALKIYPVYLGLNSGAYFGFQMTPTYERLQTPFEPLGLVIEPGKYQYLRYLIQYGSDASRKISYLLKWETGHYYDGKMREYNFSFTFNPISHFAITAQYSLDDLHQLGKEQQNKKVSLISVEPHLALTPALLFSGLTQWNSQDHSININARFSWEYKPLSYFSLVFSNRDSTNGTKLPDQFTQFSAKLSYTKQF